MKYRTSADFRTLMNGLRPLLLLSAFLLIFSSSSFAQKCTLQTDSAYAAAGAIDFFVGDTVRFPLRVNGKECQNCQPVCLNCDKLDYALTDGMFVWMPDLIQRNLRTTLKFGLTCPTSDSTKTATLAVNVRIVKFPHKVQLDIDGKTPAEIKSELTEFINKKGARIIQMLVREGDTISFKLSTPKNSPGKLTVIQSNPSFGGITYADTKSIVVFWVPDYSGFKINPIHELRFTLTNGALSNDGDQVSKVIKFKIALQHNRPPVVDKTRSNIVDLDAKGDTYINLPSYFISSYDKKDDLLQFDYSPKNIECIKTSPDNSNELVIKRTLFLTAQSRPSELIIRAKHSNSQYSESVHLHIKSNYEPLGMALEDRRFSFYDGDKIDELIKVDSNEPFRLEQNQIKVVGDTNLFDLKKIIRWEDQNSQYLHMYTVKNVEIEDVITDDLRFSIILKFVNDLKKESIQTISISIHPRVNGDVARSYFKKQIDSLRVFQDTIKNAELRIARIRDHKANRIDWYSKGISFVAIIIGSYGTSKNQSNYGYSIMAGLALGALFVDLKDIDFFITRKFRKAKTAGEDLAQLESDVEKHLIADTDKMGISFFEANYRQSEIREHADLRNTYRTILRKFNSK